MWPLLLLAAEGGSTGDTANASSLLLIAGLGAVAYIVGHLTRRFLSEVIVFFAIGITIGPEVLNIVDARDLIALEPVIAVALGAIVFGIGERLELPALKGIRHTLTPIAVLENVLTLGLVFVAMLIVGLDPGPAFLLGAIALSTSPTTLIAVINERRAKGPLTDHTQAATALNNVTSALLYGLSLPLVLASRSTSGVGEGLTAFAQLIVASFIIGIVAGWVLRRWNDTVHGVGERLLFVLVVLLMTVAVSRWVGAPVVVSTLVAGAYTANDPRDMRPLFQSLRTLDAPIFLVFFVVAGASVHLQELVAIGGLGVAFVIGRLGGKILGSWAGVEMTRSGRRSGWGPGVGYGLLPFAGMAIGLAVFTLEKATEAGLPELGGQVSAIVLGSVVVFELIGPVTVGKALDDAGESGAGAAAEEAAAAAEQQAAPHRIRHLLFPVSSPEMARQKGPVVVDLALSAGAALTALHVVRSGQAPEPDVADPALSIVKQFAASRGVPFEEVVREADSVVDAIVEEARKAAVDLVVLGEPAHRLLDLNARKVVHDVAERVDPGVRVMVVPTALDRRGRPVTPGSGTIPAPSPEEFEADTETLDEHTDEHV